MAESLSSHKCAKEHTFLYDGALGRCPEGYLCQCGKTQTHWQTCSSCKQEHLQVVPVASCPWPGGGSLCPGCNPGQRKIGAWAILALNWLLCMLGRHPWVELRRALVCPGSMEVLVIAWKECPHCHETRLLRLLTEDKAP